jgi:preprotein translocase subunit YajC
MSFIASLLAVQEGAPRNPTIILVIYVVAFIGIMWFVIIAPQRRIQRKHQDMIAAVKKGDEVMTEGGIIGTVVHLADDRLTLKTGENTRITVARAKVARVISAETATPSS